MSSASKKLRPGEYTARLIEINYNAFPPREIHCFGFSSAGAAEEVARSSEHTADGDEATVEVEDYLGTIRQYIVKIEILKCAKAKLAKAGVS